MRASSHHPRRARAARPLAALVVLAATALAVSGCFNPFFPEVLGRGVSAPPPAPNSASGVLQLLEWAYENRDYSVYKTLFTDDYRFVFGTLDTAGNAYRQTPWTREDEMAYARNLFEGEDASKAAATNIVLVLDKTFTEFRDPREGKDDFTRFRAIRTQVQLNITDENGAQTNVTGKALFFLVRGDSARIPDELGLGPDVNRWYVNRWEDETFSPLGSNLVADAGGPGAGPAGLARRPGARPAAAGATTAARPGRATSAPAWFEDPFYEASWGWVKAAYR